MINGFSNEATEAVYATICDRPDLYDQMLNVVRVSPSRALDEIRTFSQRYVDLSTSALGNDLALRLIDASMRAVRWVEIRQALQRDLSRA